MARGERTREVTGRHRVESINGDGSSKLKRERHGRGETREVVTRLRLPMVRQRLEGRAVRRRWSNWRRLGLWPKEGEEGATSTEPKGGGVGLGWVGR
jgi:hypothetical protein